MSPGAISQALSHTTTAPSGGISDVATPTWQTNGRVNTITISGTVEYVGGDFTAVRPPGSPSGKAEVRRRHAAAIDLTTGQVLPWNPKPDGAVMAIAAAPDRVVLGGSFTTAGGAAAANIAEVDSVGGAAVGGFSARTNNPVAALASDGTTIYLGGRFTKVNGVVETRLAAVSAATGELVPGFSASANDIVKSLVLAAPGELVVGGAFTQLGSVAQQFLGAIDPVTGATEAWAPAIGFPVISMAASGASVYVGGGGAGGNLAAVDVASGQIGWRAGTDGNVQAVAVQNGAVYLGGHFENYCGNTVGAEVCPPGTSAPRNKLFALDATTGGLLSWRPTPNSVLGVYALSGSGSSILAGGDFTKVHGIAQQGLATFS